MPGERLRAMKEIDEKVVSGLTFIDWETVVQHPEDPGNFPE